MKFMTREQIRRFDEIAERDRGIPGLVLMENAGRGAAEVVREELAGKAGPAVIVAGTGNNGGDGFVVARHLAVGGAAVRVLLAGGAGRLAGDARTNFEAVVKMGIAVEEIGGEGGAERLAAALAGGAVVVDALFGTGLDRPVAGAAARAIEAINASGLPVVSLDVPSGVDCDTGLPLGAAVRATRTVAFAFLKRGIVVHPGAGYAGRVTVVSIGAPGDIARQAGWDGELLDAEYARRRLGPRAPDTHKGTYGHVLVVAGSAGRTGAALMAAQGALRSGAGLVTVATRPGCMAAMESAKPVEAMLAALDPGDPSCVERLAAGKDAVAFGPGSGTDGEASALLAACVERVSAPLVVDADGLTLLAASPELLRPRRGPWVLTPHPGEMARLAGVTTEEVLRGRVPLARELAARAGAVVVLKGARTVVAGPGGEVFVNPTGNPGMASGGSGDVLTGIVASLAAQGIPPLDAACVGAFVHGEAGDAARETQGERGLVASDIVRCLPGVLSAYERPFMTT